MECRRCGQLIEPDQSVRARVGPGVAARRYEDCIWRCACGVAYSNARDPGSRTLIHPRAEDNIPPPARAGLDDVLALAINETARRSKRFRFAFHTSEDALTWTVVRALQQQRGLGALLPSTEVASGDPSLLLWGAPAGGSEAVRMQGALVTVCDSLGEVPRRRSEPDVVILWPNVLAVVEVKHRSRNDKKGADYPNWSRYLGRDGLFNDRDDVRRLGSYELTRNWRIGTELAESLGAPRFVLVNLGPETIASSAAAFDAQLARSDARAFVHRTWETVLRDAGSQSLWLIDYLDDRGVVARDRER